jgi:colanic acid/amylovoran biosynthesis glycosyltransferase
MCPTAQRQLGSPQQSCLIRGYFEKKDKLKLAYLLNTYPMTSTTFIKREIRALEMLGIPVTRYAVRIWKEDLVDQSDVDERDRTHYLLSGNVLKLFLSTFIQIFFSPMRSFKAFLVLLSLWLKGGGALRHCAYFMQACYFCAQAKNEGITHVHSHFATNATTVCLLSKLMDGPDYSFTVHGPDEFVNSERLAYPIKVRLSKFVVAISHFCKSQISLCAPGTPLNKILIVRCGLSLEEFTSHRSVAIKANQVVCVGRLCPQKSQILIPFLSHRLQADFPLHRILLVGDGESRSEIEAEIIRFGVGENVQVLGWKSNPEVRRLLAESRVLLLPSYAEGLPVVIMEAFASGTPVISTYIAGIPELLSPDCGWIVPAGSSAELESALRQVLSISDARLAEMGEVGRSKVANLHDIQKSARLLIERFALQS